MNTADKNFGFPFAVNRFGGITASGGSEAIRGKIIQVLFTTPGERVNMPAFGCGLFNLAFEPNDSILASAMEFTIRQALNRWLKRDILVEAVNIKPPLNELRVVEIIYTKKQDLTKQAVRIQFK